MSAPAAVGRLEEMARSKVRFGLLVAAIALLVFLSLFQQSLQNGLITGFIGAIRNQNAPMLVSALDGQRVIQASIFSPELEGLARSAEGVGTVGQIDDSRNHLITDTERPVDAVQVPVCIVDGVLAARCARFGDRVISGRRAPFGYQGA